MEKKIYLAWLHYIWISQKKLHQIFENSQNYKEIYDNISNSFLICNWFNNNQIEYILEKKSKLKLNYLEKKLSDRGVKIITFFDNNYPDLLKQISNPPYLFYLRWKIDNSPKIAVIWARNITSYWKTIIQKIIPDLSKYFVIISWGAAWCDTQWHIVALDNWNKTISVIWTWIDIDYPIWNKKLYDTIVDLWGWIISIFPIWEVWNPYNFPVRNEIVAWLSIWVFIIEAKEKSWSLITSNLALENWKDLFAAPWDITKLNSEWCNNLIKSWSAKLTTNVDDILNEYNISSINKKIKIRNFACRIEENIYNLLLLESYTTDELSKKLSVDIITITYKLSMMEINGQIKKWIWWKYEVN
jgi:DNA processing protein